MHKNWEFIIISVVCTTWAFIGLGIGWLLWA